MFLAALAALAFPLIHAPHDSAQAKNESAYARVIRTQTLRFGYFL